MRSRFTGRRWNALIVPVILLGAFAFAARNDLKAQAGAFALERLPKGKSVTIPRPATTLVSYGDTVRLTSTDMPQSVSFKATSGSGAGQALRLAIYDPLQENVQYIDVKPNTPFLYAFKEIGSITVVTDVQAPKAGSVASLKLVVESDKPLEIAR